MLIDLKSNMPMGDQPNYVSPWWGGDDLTEVTRLKSIAPASWRYHQDTIEYRFNSHGYRMPEFEDINWSNYIIVLGCSHTMGVGLALEDLWHSQVGQLDNTSVVNLAQAGTGIQCLVNNLSVFLRHAPQQPKQIIVQWPSRYRMRVWDRMNQRHDLPSDGDLSLQQLYKSWINLEYNTINWAKEQRNTVLALADLAGADYWEFCVNDSEPMVPMQSIAISDPKLELAAHRDLKNCGRGPIFLRIPDTPAVVKYINQLARDLNPEYWAHPGSYYNQQVIEHYRKRFNI